MLLPYDIRIGRVMTEPFSGYTGPEPRSKVAGQTAIRWGRILSVVSSELDSRRTTYRYTMPLEHFVSRWRFVACVQACDFVIFAVVGFLWFRTLSPEATIPWRMAHLAVSLLAATMIQCVFQYFRSYDFSVLTNGREAAFRAFAAGLISFSPFMAPLLVGHDLRAEPEGTACQLIVAGLGCVAVMRLGFARLAAALQHSGMVRQKIYVIAADCAAAESLKADLERSPEYRVVGTWIMTDQSGSNVPVEMGLEGALSFLRGNPVDAVILQLPLSQPVRLAEAARVLRRLPRKVFLALNLNGADDLILSPGVLGLASTSTLGLGQDRERLDCLGNMILIKISDRPLAGWRWVMKDVQDRAIAILLLATVAPAMMAIMIAIKLSDPKGPVFFRQKRHGYGGNVFDIIKFRTMRVADNAPEPSAFTLTTRDDPRVFPVGRILRKTSLDELPQLFNVLKGDMWIIGPRPHSPFARAGGVIYAYAVGEYFSRYRIKPGITGWAQVCGWRGPTDTLEQLSKRVEHDLYYIENWSTFFDVRILFRTLSCVFGQRNAF